MINLDSTLKSLEIVLGGAITTNQLPFLTSYVETLNNDLSLTTIGANDGQSNGSTAVTMVAAPASGYTRVIRTFTVFNADTVSAVVTVRLNNNGTFRTITKLTMAVGDTLVWWDGEARVYDANGAQRVVNNLGVPSTAHVVLIGEGLSSAIVGLTGNTNDTLQGVTGADPAFTAAPTFPSATVTNTLTANGLIDASGASAGQIKFPATQNPSANVNTLDDYEEGTWTPVIGGSGGTSGQSYNVQQGSYVKVGKLVTATYKIAFINKGTITGSVQLQGLPFTIENVANQQSAYFIEFTTLLTSWIAINVQLIVNSTTGAIVGNTAAAVSNTTALATADIANGTFMIGMIAFKASA